MTQHLIETEISNCHGLISLAIQQGLAAVNLFLHAVVVDKVSSQANVLPTLVANTFRISDEEI